MFDAGVRPAGNAVNGFVDLHERIFGSGKETICSRAAHVALANLSKNSPVDALLFAASVRGGTPYVGLKSGTSVFEELLRLVTRAKEITENAGDELACPAICFLHGEADFGLKTTRSDYRRYMQEFRADAENEFGKILGNCKPKILLSQTNSAHVASATDPRISTAQLDVSLGCDGFVCVGPSYWVPLADPHHFSSVGYAKLGEVFGHALALTLNGERFEPLHIIDVARAENSIVLRYNMPVELVASDARDADYGFDLINHDGKAVRIEAVRVVSDHSVMLDVMNFSGELFYACRATTDQSGNRVSPRGCIRAREPVRQSTLEGNLHHWACVQTLEVRRAPLQYQ